MAVAEEQQGEREDRDDLDCECGEDVPAQPAPLARSVDLPIGERRRRGHLQSTLSRNCEFCKSAACATKFSTRIHSSVSTTSARGSPRGSTTTISGVEEDLYFPASLHRLRQSRTFRTLANGPKSGVSSNAPAVACPHRMFLLTIDGIETLRMGASSAMRYDTRFSPVIIALTRFSRCRRLASTTPQTWTKTSSNML